MIQAKIVSIGDEILLGDTLDTNAHFIAKKLNEINIQLKEIQVISDSERAIKKAFSDDSIDIIISTGGLGPTRDDKTKYILAEMLDEPLLVNPKALEWAKEYYERVLNRPINKNTETQALCPQSSTPLQNKSGTAPALWTIVGSTHIFNLPGIPAEMEHLMDSQILPQIQKTFVTDFILHRYINFVNIPESVLADQLSEVEDNLPSEISLAYLPTGRRIKLRLSARGSDPSLLNKKLDESFARIVSLTRENIYGFGNTRFEELIAHKLTEKQLTISTAESFSSGKVAQLLTSVSGSSAYFRGGIVAYHSAIKIEQLGVDEVWAKNNGVVNKEVAAQMAEGAKERMQTDIAIATTGVAGPQPDDFDNPVGKAFIAIALADTTEVFEYFYPNLSRQKFIERMADLALIKLWEFLEEL